MKMTRAEMLEKLIPALRMLDAGAADLAAAGMASAKKVHAAACGLQEVAEAILEEMKEAHR